MRKLDLKEHERSGPEELSVEERDALSDFLTVEPAIGEHSKYHLTPSSTVGALEVGDLSVSIQPKLPVARVLYLASHAIGAIGFREELFGYQDEPTLIEALAPVFAAAARRALSRGLLHGYRTEEDSLQTVRGRIRLDKANRVRLKPDLTWWVEGKCTFVGDAKYKKVHDERVPNADLYQLLAYTTALDLPGGLLIYAKGEDEEIEHLVRHADKRLRVAALDLSGSIKQIDLRVQYLAKRVRELSQNAVADPLAA